MSEENVTENVESSGEEVSEEVESQEDLELQDGEEVEASSEKPKSAQEKKIEKEIKQLKKLKLKVDGEEFEEEFDPNDDEYLTKQLQLAKMAQKRGQSQKELERDVQEFFQLLKTNPKKALSSDLVGMDLKQFAAQIIEEEIERSQKTPEQLALEEKEEELRQLRAEREKELKSRQEKEFQEKQQMEMERYDRLIEKALDSTNLPKSPYTVKKMADWMYLALDNGIEITPDEVANLVQEEMKSDLNQMFTAMPEEVIEQLIGTSNLDRIRKKKIQAAKSKKLKEKTIPVTKQQKSEEKQTDKKITFNKYFGNF